MHADYTGIHIRTFSRAFIIDDPTSGGRVVFVSCDTAMMSQLVKVDLYLHFVFMYFCNVLMSQLVKVKATKPNRLRKVLSVR